MAALSSLKASVRGLRGMRQAVKGLTDAEAAKLNRGTAERFLALRRALPSSNELSAVARAGQAKKGWYRNSTQALQEVFGEDAPRFTALLAGLSPQTSVESNLVNALNVWKNWNNAQRPTDKQSIMKIMGDSVEGSRGQDSVLDAWVNNSVDALQSQDPSSIVLSGPKVDSFMRNLNGVMHEVTNDTWMARVGGVPQEIFSGGRSASDAGKGAGYLAMNSKVRDTAKRLEDLTGESWDPAEVQETVWSWAYGLRNRDKGQRIMENLQELTDRDITTAPDFGTLMQEPKYAGPLTEAGYEKELGALADRPSVITPGSEDFAQAALVRDPDEIRRAARRIALGYGERGSSSVAPMAAAGAAGLGALALGSEEAQAGVVRNATDMLRGRTVDDPSYMRDSKAIVGNAQAVARRTEAEQARRETGNATERMRGRAATGAGALAVSENTWADELVGAGLAAGSIGGAMMTGLGAEAQALAGALNPMMSSQEAVDYAARARSVAPPISQDPRAQPYLEGVLGGLETFGEDVSRGFGTESPLYRNVPGYSELYDAVPALWEQLPERVRLGMGALGNLAF